MFYEQLGNLCKNLGNIKPPNDIFQPRIRRVQAPMLSDIFTALDTSRRKTMATHIPSIGNWYQDIAVNRLFEIVSIDDYSATIDIRYEDGEYDDIAFDSWSEMALGKTGPPEDWRSSKHLSDDQRFYAHHSFMPFTDPFSDASADSMSGRALDSHFGWDEF
jgi:hypothetical protein|tara:strand:- start:1004 stop:1486 length:483 start_codon:yes stop_codon:yes gene_type:complete